MRVSKDRSLLFFSHPTWSLLSSGPYFRVVLILSVHTDNNPSFYVCSLFSIKYWQSANASGMWPIRTPAHKIAHAWSESKFWGSKLQSAVRSQWFGKPGTVSLAFLSIRVYYNCCFPYLVSNIQHDYLICGQTSPITSRPEKQFSDTRHQQADMRRRELVRSSFPLCVPIFLCHRTFTKCSLKKNRAR